MNNVAINAMKKFFSVDSKKYIFEWDDISTLLTILSVALIVKGFWWAPFFGLINSGLGIVLNIKRHAHLNAYITQIALVVLNTYFLK